ncbi:hypothetical protein TNCV_3588371 [Trichonephila clavipes]|nr:hypothetical protein TNCV_3588371 [Trichonephila clavipes]
MKRQTLRTLQYLPLDGATLRVMQETLGVCVASFGASKDFPSFFTPKSNFKAPYNVESFAEAARLIASCVHCSIQHVLNPSDFKFLNRVLFGCNKHRRYLDE